MHQNMNNIMKLTQNASYGSELSPHIDGHHIVSMMLDQNTTAAERVYLNMEVI